MIRKLFLKKMTAKTNQLPNVTWNLLKLHLRILINEETLLPTHCSAPWSAPPPQKKTQQLSGSKKKNLQLWTPLEVKACHLAVTLLNYTNVLWCSWISFNWHVPPPPQSIWIWGVLMLWEVPRTLQLRNAHQDLCAVLPYSYKGDSGYWAGALL